MSGRVAEVSQRCPHCGDVHPRDAKACPMTGRPMPGAFVAGQVLDGKYKIIRHLADGGMGSVYEAEHLALGRHIAIKTLHPDLATDQDMVMRLQKEARAASAIGHEHIVDIHDLGRSNDGTIFIVMELLRGENLADRLRSAGGVLPIGRAAHILRQVLHALGAAHHIGIIHRDLKPENIFLVTRHEDPDFVKVLDFGISKMLADSPDAKLTSTGFVLGTPYYMAPEQARGGQLDHRIDLYACGALLYHLTTGRVPFNAPNFNALMFEIAAGRFAPPRQLMPSMAPAFERVIIWAMDLDPARRLQSAEKFNQAIAPFVQAPETPGRRLPKSSMPTLVVEANEASRLVNAEQRALGGAMDFDDRQTSLLDQMQAEAASYPVGDSITPSPDTDPSPLVGALAAQVAPPVGGGVGQGPTIREAPAPVVVPSGYPGHPGGQRPHPVYAAAPHPASAVLDQLAAHPPPGGRWDLELVEAPWRRYLPLGIGAGTGLLVGLILVIAIGAGRSAKPPEPVVDRVAGLPPGVTLTRAVVKPEPEVPNPRPDPVSLRTVGVTFKISPSEAAPEITIDGKPIAGRTATLALAPGAKVRVLVKASGYEPWDADLALQDGQNVPVLLKKKSSRPSGGKRPGGGKPGSGKTGPGGSIDL